MLIYPESTMRVVRMLMHLSNCIWARDFAVWGISPPPLNFPPNRT